jgi:hypothetical protein
MIISTPSVIRTVWGRGAADYLRVRTTEGKLRDKGNLQQIVTKYKIKIP